MACVSSKCGKPGVAMTRSPRKRSESNVHHVVARGTGRQIIFENDRDRQTYLGMLSKLAEEHDCSLFAWCLMDNHVHLLVKAETEQLSTMMKRLDSAYAIVFNMRNERVGHLFQGRFKSEPVESDAYLMTVVRYIHQNPEVAGLGAMRAYPWSSFPEYIGPPGITDTAFVLSVFGGIEAFLDFHGEKDPSAPCIDENRGRNLLDASAAYAAASKAIAPAKPGDVKGMSRRERNAAIARMREASLSVRQIERLTGVSRGIIARIPRGKAGGP